MRLMAVSLVSLIVLGGLLAWNSRSQLPSAVPPLVVYCAVALQPPIEELARAYEAETAVPVQVEYGASQIMLARLEFRRNGDLFIPADEDYLQMARDKGLLQSSVPLTRLRPVVAVAAGNPRNVKTLEDLLRDDVRLTLPDPKTAAIGRAVRSRLAGRWDELQAHAQIVRPTVGDVATDIKLGVADATFVWDETAHQIAGLAAIELPELAGVEVKIAAGILTTSRQGDTARNFASYLAASNRGQRVFQRCGYRTFDGQPWSRPESR